MSGIAFTVSDGWRDAFPGAIVAALAFSSLTNPVTTEPLDAAKRELETELRTRWAGLSRAELRSEPVLAVYDRYYKGFGQNYHVQMQIESIALKQKPIPSRMALVEA